MSKLLRKILSAALFPAALVIVAKIAGMALANTIYDLNWSIQTNAGTLFSVQITYPDIDSAILCNSFSNLMVVSALAIGTSVLLFQNRYLNTSRQNPKVLIKLMQFDFILWLSESASIFPKLAVWSAFLWVITIITITQAIQSESYQWVAVTSLVITVIASWLTARDFENEVHTILPENGKLSTS